MYKNINHLELKEHIEGNERRLEFIKEPLKNGSFLPQTVTLEDIDKTFKEWANTLNIKSDDGRDFPTMTLYSNQRFSEYMQSWKYTDSNNNLLLNFKTVSRNNNPTFGDIQGKYYNIPSDIFFHMKTHKVLDDNGTESLLKLQMKQPTALDITYKLSIFTTNYHSLNDFNVLINRMFNGRQVYINPNGYYMPMTLDNISDESQYNIDDRQFYSQIYEIRVNAFILTEDDFRYEEIPLKQRVNFNQGETRFKKTDVEIEEFDEDMNESGNGLITISFNSSSSTSKFNIDTNFTINKIEKSNLYDALKIIVNGKKIDNIIGHTLKENDEIKIIAKKVRVDKISTLKIIGNII